MAGTQRRIRGRRHQSAGDWAAGGGSGARQGAGRGPEGASGGDVRSRGAAQPRGARGGQRRAPVGGGAGAVALTWAAPHSGRRAGDPTLLSRRPGCCFPPFFFLFFFFFRSGGGGGSSSIRQQPKAESVSGCERAGSGQRGRRAERHWGAARRAARELRRSRKRPAEEGASLRGRGRQCLRSLAEPLTGDRDLGSWAAGQRGIEQPGPNLQLP